MAVPPKLKDRVCADADSPVMSNSHSKKYVVAAGTVSVPAAVALSSFCADVLLVSVYAAVSAANCS